MCRVVWLPPAVTALHTPRACCHQLLARHCWPAPGSGYEQELRQRRGAVGGGGAAGPDVDPAQQREEEEAARASLYRQRQLESGC